MKEKIGKIVIAMMVIMTMTMGNVLIVGQGLISNAESGNQTNHKNVQFNAYWKTKDGKISQEIEDKIQNVEDSLIIEVEVQNEGYLNGSIKIEDSNFNIKGVKKSNKIKEIKENEIALNTIRAGEKVEIEVQVQANMLDEIEEGFLEKTNKIKLQGTYRDQTEKDINIEGEKEVRLTLENPYEEQKGSILSGQVLTNKTYKIGEETKRIVQIKIRSGLEGNKYPIKQTDIKVEGMGEAEQTTVDSIRTKATNGLEGNEQTKQKYKSETISGGITTVKITNQEENGNMKWSKTGEDEIIVTYILDQNVQIKGQEIKITSNIELADNKTNKQAETVVKIEGDKDGTVTYQVTGQEQTIYKGKVYSKEERLYKTTKVIQINYAQLAQKIESQEKVAKYEVKKEKKEEANSYYKTTNIEKQEIDKILGETGKLTIKNQNEKEIVQINKESQADEKGNIVINYPKETKEINIEIENPVEQGEIKLNHTKAIKENKNKEEIREYKAIIETIEGTNKESASKGIKLEDPSTQAKIEIGKDTLTTVEQNEDIEIKATLQTNGEDKDLYKDPKLKIIFPQEVEQIKVKSLKMIYEKDLKIKEAKQYEENGKQVIEIEVQGEQTKYKEEAIEGAEIRINTDIKLSEKAGSSTKEITMQYSNEKATKTKGEAKAKVHIEAPRGIVTINKIDSLGMKSIGQEATKTAKLKIGQEAKEAEVVIEVKNNNEEDINNVEIIGTFPTKAEGTQNNMETEIVEGLNVNGKQAKISYSTQENATEESIWTDKIGNGKEVKSYKIEVDNLKVGEEITANYKVAIPENLSYNAQAYEGYSINYTNSETKQQETANATIIGMSTGTGPEIKQENIKMTAKVGGQEVTNNGEVKQGEIIKYEIQVKNTGTEVAENVKITAPVPEGTVLMTIEPKSVTYEVPIPTYYEEVQNQKEVTSTIETINPNETKTLSYEVKVKKDTQDGTNITNKANIEYNGISLGTNEIVNTVKQSNLEMLLQPVDIVIEDEYDTIPYKNNEYKVEIGTAYRYIITVVNNSNQELKNTEIKLNKSAHYNGGITYDMIDITNTQNITVQQKDENTCVIDSIAANSTVYIPVSVVVEKVENNYQTYMMATAILNGNTSHSNYYQERTSETLVEIEQSSPNENQFVKPEDIIEYTIKIKNLSGDVIDGFFYNTLSDYVTFIDISKNGTLLQNYEEMEIPEDENIEGYYYYTNEIENLFNLQPNEEVEYKIRVQVNTLIENTEVLQIVNIAKVQRSGTVIAQSNDLVHLLEPDKGIPSTGEDQNGGDLNNNGNNSNINENTQVISGTAWLDSNADGRRDSGEPVLPQVNVRLLNLTTNSFQQDITATTNENGFYTLLNVPQGRYIVVFEYDDNKYMLTTYQAEGVLETENSDVIADTMQIDGIEKQVGVTDTIEIAKNSVAGIDIGLREAKVFDLQLNKYVSKIVVQNKQGTNTYEFNDETLAKVEVDGKQINNTNVVIEYKIKVTNSGEIPGYVRKITDYLPADMKFSSELNSGWYQEGDGLNSKELANTKLQAGETKEITLTLTKQMTETNTGLIHNTAEIIDQYNELGAKDTNSTPGNQVEGENDMGSADVIIGIKTGAMISYVMLTISIIIVLGIGAYFISKKILRGKI